MKYYIVEFQKNNTGWMRDKKLEWTKKGTSSAKVIHYDTIEETEYTVNYYKKLGFEVRVVEKESKR